MTYINSNISNHLPKITLDYINAEESLKSFYHKKNDIENYLDQIKEKNKLYNHNFREVLKNELLNQYRNLSNNKKQLDQIKVIRQEYFYSHNWSSIKFIHWSFIFFIK